MRLFGRMKAERFAVTCRTASETGLVRTENQDHVFVDPAKTLYCVADGMGGGSEGARASEIVCEELAKVVPGGLAALIKGVDAALAGANERIFRHAKEMGFKQMGSTLAALVVDPDDMRHALVCHVGDSRVYRVRESAAELLTHDHTVGGQLSTIVKGSQAGELRNRANPLAHVLTRAVGVEPSVTGEWRRIDIKSGDTFLVCSDGVHDVVSDSRIARILSSSIDLEAVVKALTDRVVSRGAPDNYSFVVVRFATCGRQG